jgi:hypothetical protein
VEKSHDERRPCHKRRSETASDLNKFEVIFGSRGGSTPPPRCDDYLSLSKGSCQFQRYEQFLISTSLFKILQFSPFKNRRRHRRQFHSTGCTQ